MPVYILNADRMKCDEYIFQAQQNGPVNRWMSVLNITIYAFNSKEEEKKKKKKQSNQRDAIFTLVQFELPIIF